MGLDTVELLMSVEETFDLPDLEGAVADVRTVGELHAAVVNALRAAGRRNLNGHIVMDQLRTLICHHLGVEPSEVTPEARFVEDLGAG